MSLLAPACTSWRELLRMTALSRPTSFPALLHAVTRLLRLAMRSLRLMRCVRMILGLEVLGLVWGTPAIDPGHRFLLNDPSGKHPARSLHSPRPARRGESGPLHRGSASGHRLIPPGP